MKKQILFGIIFLLTTVLVGCYTIISHPIVKNGDNYHRVKFYNDCNSCHSNLELIDYGYLQPMPSTGIISDPYPMWITPSYLRPWWLDIQVSTTVDDAARRNDNTRLRDLDGGRTSAPTNVLIPSRSTGSSSSSSSSSSNSNNDNSNNTSNERNSRDSNTPKSRDNSGERKK